MVTQNYLINTLINTYVCKYSPPWEIHLKIMREKNSSLSSGLESLIKKKYI